MIVTGEKVTVVVLEDGSKLLTGEDGKTAKWPAPLPADRPRLEFDPRIDMTKPIWAQFDRLRKKDLKAEKARVRAKADTA